MTLTKERARLLHGVQAVVSDAERLLNAAGAGIADKAHDQKRKLDRIIAAAKDGCHDAREQAARTAQKADKLVRQHPGKSLAFSFAAGLAFGVLITWRSR